MVSLAFGKGQLSVALPRGVNADVVEPRFAPAADDPAATVVQAVTAPIGTPPLSELIRGKRSIAIAVPDGTRPLPFREVLPPILEQIATEIPREKIEILFATGMHRPVGRDEAAALLGDTIAGRFRWSSHDPDSCKKLGSTASGIPVSINRRYLAADVKIVVGLVEPHLLAGVSGGRKMIAPGLIGRESMPTLHGPEIIGHEDARAGLLDGNPFHTESLEIARMAGVDFAVNVIIGEDGGVSSVVAGELDQSHRTAATDLREKCAVNVHRKYGAAICSGGGAPIDATLYQSIKGAIAALPLLEPGGSILLCADWTEGLGSDAFTDLLKTIPDLDLFHTWSKKNFREDQWMLQHLRELQRDADVRVWSPRISAEQLQELGIQGVTDPEEAVREMTGDGVDTIAALPRGPWTWIMNG